MTGGKASGAGGIGWRYTPILEMALEARANHLRQMFAPMQVYNERWARLARQFPEPLWLQSVRQMRQIVGPFQTVHELVAKQTLTGMGVTNLQQFQLKIARQLVASTGVSQALKNAAALNDLRHLMAAAYAFAPAAEYAGTPADQAHTASGAEVDQSTIDVTAMANRMWSLLAFSMRWVTPKTPEQSVAWATWFSAIILLCTLLVQIAHPAGITPVDLDVNINVDIHDNDFSIIEFNE